MSDHPLPTEDEVRGYLDRHSNWGRWGADDHAGTVNLITPKKRREAAGLVRTGRAVSLAFPLNTVGGPGNWNPAQHYVRSTKDACGDYIGIFYHGYATTHIDALCHIFWEGQMYNGRPASEVTSLGARAAAVDAWSQGISTRGVLIDIPRFRGTPFVTNEAPVRGWEIEAAAEKEGVDLREGDAVIVRSGRPAFYEANPDLSPGIAPSPGLHADCIPVLHAKGAALLGWDMMDARPSGYRLFDEGRMAGGAVHVLAIVFMGLPLLDNASLEPLAAACAEEGRYEFMLTIAPLHVRGGTGSPVNPIALF
jgi:kynurenine formamidase